MSVKCEHMLRGVTERNWEGVTGWTELCSREGGMHTTVLFGKPEGKDHLEDIDIDGTTILKHGFLTLSLLMSYVYGAPSKAGNLTS
jgi:hypothetical protein